MVFSTLTLLLLISTAMICATSLYTIALSGKKIDSFSYWGFVKMDLFSYGGFVKMDSFLYGGFVVFCVPLDGKRIILKFSNRNQWLVVSSSLIHISLTPHNVEYNTSASSAASRPHWRLTFYCQNLFHTTLSAGYAYDQSIYNAVPSCRHILKVWKKRYWGIGRQDLRNVSWNTIFLLDEERKETIFPLIIKQFTSDKIPVHAQYLPK